MNNIQFDFSHADLGLKETVYIYHKTRPENYTLKQTNRTCYGLAIMLSGEAEYDYGDRRFIAVPGDVLFFKKGENYTVRVTENAPWEHIVISFDLWDEGEIDGFPLETVNKVQHFKRMEDLFLTACRLFNGTSAARNLECKAMIYQIFARLLEEKQRQFQRKNKYEGIRDAVEYIETGYQKKIDLETLADISGYSVSHFGRIFKELYGMSPLDYVNHVRVNKAKNMLRTEMFTLAEVAEECGFANVYYFSRVFKQISGITPKKY